MSTTSDCKQVSAIKEYFDAMKTHNIVLFVPAEDTQKSRVVQNKSGQILFLGHTALP